MTTITQEINQLEQKIAQTLTNHRQQLTKEQDQINCLIQLLKSSKNNHLDAHCVKSIDRLIDLLNSTGQSNDRIYNALNSLTQAKDAQNLTIDAHGKIATILKLELGELATRLKVDPSVKLSAATNNPVAWAKVMKTYPDPDGYQWEYPGFKFGFYHNTHRQVTGTKAVNLAANSSDN